jgi:precorrin-8X/cobalt-precorrin-8 methylmutase
MARPSIANLSRRSGPKPISRGFPDRGTSGRAHDPCLGLVGLESQVAFTPGMADAARAALRAGAPILCDARMVSEGITRARLPADNPVLCTLHDPRVPDMARAMGNTRSAAALELWRPHLAGSVVAIGNAPTALFHLLDMLEDPACPRPAAIIGCPVGFVGAMESKQALMAAPPAPPWRSMAVSADRR